MKKICMQRFIKIDGKVRTDRTHYARFMDIISIDKGDNFCLLCDIKGCFGVHHITPEEIKYKLCKVRKILVGTKGIPHLLTHDARTICYPDPLIKVNETIQIDLETGKILISSSLMLITSVWSQKECPCAVFHMLYQSRLWFLTHPRSLINYYTAL
ncbi:hypothetical protein H8958_022647 [Nasalis larvatus]